MQIFIMRHGQASFQAGPDAQRPLTAQGQLEASLMASWLDKMDISPSVIWTSPFIRAKETADLVVEKLSAKTLLKTIDFITPADSASNVRDYLDGVLSSEDISQLLIVSHMPLVSYLVAELTQHQQAPLFQTATIVEIDYNPKTNMGRLVRMVSPIDLC